MKSARVAYAGAIHYAAEQNGRLRLTDGLIVGEDDVVWLPPIQPGTIFALGLNYADHAKELAFKAPDEPLVFLKGPQSLCGHRGQTRRPRDVKYMHYECELAVVIGKTARKVSENTPTITSPATLSRTITPFAITWKTTIVRTFG